MKIFEPHIHMLSRVTDDYERMALAGIRVVLEPAFWIGQPRTNLGCFLDYFDTLVGWERFRASQFGVHHVCTMALNPREANDDRVNRDVLAALPRYLEKDGVVGVGEIGLDDQTPTEERCFLAQVDLARAHGLPVLIHTPHRDKKRGFERIIAMLRESRFPMERVLLDHGNEETLPLTRDLGCVSGFSLYPHTKMDVARMTTIVREHGVDRIVVNSAADWGVSDPLMVPKLVQSLLRAGVEPRDVERLVWDNPVGFFAQSGRLDPAALERPPLASRRETFGGNTVLRGQDPDKY
ncbi:MAG: TatD family hydrolase [Planctomycetes bacterium]|nr:TatD family hydrolase [Planctomycetota bacterium]